VHRQYRGALRLVADEMYGAADKIGRLLEDPGPGLHLWIVVGIWPLPSMIEVGGVRGFVLDSDDLLSLMPACCYKCSRDHAATSITQPCTGSMPS
jgi:hypothetical protein